MISETVNGGTSLPAVNSPPSAESGRPPTRSSGGRVAGGPASRLGDVLLWALYDRVRGEEGRDASPSLMSPPPAG